MNKKIIAISLDMNETDVSKNNKQDTSETFWNTDKNGAAIRFNSKESLIGCVASLVLTNITDGSVVQRKININETPFEYLLSGEEIERAGTWYGQVVVEKDEVALTNRIFSFTIQSSLLDMKEGVLIDVYDYKLLHNQLNVLRKNLESYLTNANASELARESNYLAKVDAAIVSADIERKVSTKVTELTPTINKVVIDLADFEKETTAQFQQTNEYLAQKASINYVDAILMDIAKGGPKGHFMSIAALEAADFPNGKEGTWLVFDSSFSDGAHSFMWDSTNSNWKDLGVYQSTGTAPKTIDLTKLTDDLAESISKFINVGVPVKDHYYSTSGILTPLSGRSYLMVNCRQDDKFKTTTLLPGSAGTAMAIFLKQDGKFLSYLNIGTSGTSTQYTNYEFSAPAGAYKVIINGTNDKPLTLSKIQAINVNAILSEVDEIKSDIGQYYKMNYEIKKGYYYQRTFGTLLEASDKQTLKVAVNPGDELMTTTTVSGSALAMAVFFDNSDVLVSALNPGENSVDKKYENYRFVVPKNVYSVAIDGNLSSPISLSIRKMNQIGLKVSEHSNKIEALENDVKSYWRDKKIVWFGTSIPEGRYDGVHSYPFIIAEKLGANLVNESKGSSCVRNGYPWLVTEEDSKGWTGKPWQNICFSLSQTVAEKQELINNWDFWKTKLTNNPPPMLDDTTKNLIVDCSYEKRLVERHLGDGKRADLYVFDHGFNDNDYNNLELDVLPKNHYDRKYFHGAMNYLVDLILKDNPHARILFVGHYENQQNPIVSKGQMAVADYWSRPIIKMWERTGWSNKKITTTGSWQNGYWVVDSGEAQEITIKDTWLADKIHVHSDKSGKAVNLLADLLVEDVSKHIR